MYKRQVVTFTVEASDEGTRIDSYLAQELNSLSRSYLQKILKGGGVTADGQQVKDVYKRQIWNLLPL